MVVIHRQPVVGRLVCRDAVCLGAPLSVAMLWPASGPPGGCRTYRTRRGQEV
jgi:hypothetical protein